MFLKTLEFGEHNREQPWIVAFHPEFAPEVGQFSEVVRQSIFSSAALLEKFGPQWGRPHVDALNGSKHPNMKELRFRAENGAWRVAFAFDQKRKAILLVGGDKSGMSEKRFYRNPIEIAGHRFDRHLAAVAVAKEK